MTEDTIIRYLLNETTNEENINTQHWMEESDENRKTVEQLYFVLEANKRLRIMNSVDTDRALDTFKKNRKIKEQKNKNQRILQTFQRIAAVLLLPMICLSSYLYFSHSKVAPYIEMVEMKTNAGMVSSFSLPDGSKVWLNSNSSLRYPSTFDARSREVEIDGQAYFEVVKNSKQPFIVKALDNNLKVEVLGTTFDVQAYKKDGIVETTLVTGSVQLDIAGRRTKTVILPSEKAVYSLHTNQLHITTVDTDREIDWMYNRLVFKETPMAEVLAHLARFYNIEFEVKNRIINTYTFTGTFEDKPLYQVLDYMKISSNINYKITYPKDEKGTKSIIVLSK
ncbi:FecR family protein [Dysgonomonas sp. ZJ279]|uniref:FecR family protein n=1 Tax=Dysgonomonas sp. ZJ279 TaxID=2709796 RepID=UPI0013EBAF02|nr:FecR family protein [Dysgonomonas sp. ZJ279]